MSCNRRLIVEVHLSKTGNQCRLASLPVSPVPSRLLLPPLTTTKAVRAPLPVAYSTSNLHSVADIPVPGRKTVLLASRLDGKLLSLPSPSSPPSSLVLSL